MKSLDISDQAAEPAVATSALRLLRCPRCGYSLEGLPASGSCPECGERYSDDEIVLFGWNAKDEDVPTYLDFAIWMCIAAGTALFGIVWKICTSSPEASIVTAVGALLAIPALAGWLYVRKLKAGNAGILQLRLTPRGYGKRLGEGAVALNAWRAGMQITAAVLADAKFVLSIEKPGEKFWTFKRFVPIAVRFDGDEAIAEQVMQKIGKWWDLPVESYIHPRLHRRERRIGPLTEEAAGRAHSQRHVAHVR